MKKVPKILVDLGRAVEVIGDEWEWTWNKKDAWVIASNSHGTELYLFKRPTKEAESVPKVSTKEARALYKRFTRKVFEEALQGTVKDLKQRAGSAIHVVYESDKFGRLQEHIHVFENACEIWVDNPAKPAIMGIFGSKIRVTARGIEG